MRKPIQLPRALKDLVEDLRRYFPEDNRLRAWEIATTLWESEALVVIASYRLGQYLQRDARPLMRKILWGPWSVMHRLARQWMGIHLFPQTEIGPGLYIGHSGGIWISPRAKIGARCNINQTVTIGSAGEAAPVLGDRVWVGANATITGGVKVGEGAVVGANSLVAADVPPRGVAIGVPARVVSLGGSERLIPQGRNEGGVPQVSPSPE